MKRAPETLGELVIRSMTNRMLFGKLFMPAESWAAWRTVLRALFGLLPPDAEEFALFQKCTGRLQPFTSPVTEALLL